MYDKPIGPADQLERRAERQLLLQLVSTGHNARLSSPRRYGKTTLLRQLQLDAEQLGVPSVFVDYSGAISLEDVVARIETAYKGLLGPIRRRVRPYLKRSRPKISAGAGVVGGEVAVEPSSTEATQALLDALALPQQIRGRSGRHVLIVFDEFQDMLKVGSRVDGVMRSVIQHHQDDAAYVFAGSHPGLMNELFASKTKPLYGQARAVSLRPFEDWDLRTYIDSRFQACEREVDRVLPALLKLARGHPQRAMMLAHHLWEATELETNCESAFDRAVASVFAELRDAFRLLWRELPSAHATALEEIARSGTTADLEAAYELEANGDIVNLPSVTEMRWAIVDPLLESWILHRDALVLPASADAAPAERPAKSHDLDGPVGPRRHARITPSFASNGEEPLPLGSRVLIPTAANAPIRSGVGTIVGVQLPLAPSLGEPRYIVRLESGRIVDSTGRRLRAAGAAEFGRYVLSLFGMSNIDPQHPELPAGLDADYAQELLEVVTVIRNLAFRKQREGLSDAEDQVQKEAINALSTEIAKMTGRQRADVAMRIRMQLKRLS